MDRDSLPAGVVFAGPEDITVDRARATAYISASPREQEREAGRACKEAIESGGACPSMPQGGLFALALDALDAKPGGTLPLRYLPVRAAASECRGTGQACPPADLHPHGISLLRLAGDDRPLLFVVNHPYFRGNDGVWQEGETTVEKFRIAGDSLEWLGRVGLSGACNVNDVAAIDENRFLVTNSMRACDHAGQLWERLTGRDSGSVLLADGGILTPLLVDAFGFANGITLGPRIENSAATAEQQRSLFVADSLAGEVRRYPLDVAASVQVGSEVKAIFADAGAVDNIEWEEDGKLLVATHPSAIRFSLYGLCRLNGLWCRNWPVTGTSPSAVLRVSPSVPGQRPDEATVLFHDDGTQLSAASVAVTYGGHMLIGSVFDDRLLVCDIAAGEERHR